jgi:YbbR domain-containing protein
MKRRSFSAGVLILCLLIAVLVWGYVALTSTHEDVVRIGLTITPPESQALLSTVPTHIYVKVRGTGWQILNLRLFENAAECRIDLSRLRPGEHATYRLDRTTFLRSIETVHAVERLDVTPNAFTVATGELVVRRVPVRVRSRVACRDGFDLVGDPLPMPETVEVRGNRAEVERLTEWPTKPLDLTDLHATRDVAVAMSDSLGTMLNVVPATIRVRVRVQQTADRTIEDVPISVDQRLLRGAVIPSIVGIVVRGGVEVIDQLTPNQFRVELDVQSALRDGRVRPRVIAPAGVTVIGTIPATVRYTEVSRVAATRISDESP